MTPADGIVGWLVSKPYKTARTKGRLEQKTAEMAVQIDAMLVSPDTTRTTKGCGPYVFF